MIVGCGTGKAVVAAALSNLGFSKVWGIELLEPLSTRAICITDNMKLQLAIIDTPMKESTCNITAAKTKRIPINPIPSHAEVAVYILQQLDADADGLLACDTIVNSICQRFGHKSYKAFIKKYGSFKKYIGHCSSIFVLEENTLRRGQSSDSCDDSAEDILNIPVSGCELKDPICFTSSSLVEDGHVDLINNAAYRKDLIPLPSEISIQQGDIFLANWWSEADVAYCASLLFTDDMLQELFERCLEMKLGAIFISLRPCPSALLVTGISGRRVELLSQSFYRMTWQMAAVYVYRVI